jgi:YhcH/YjgK/YiaL family protein
MITDTLENAAIYKKLGKNFNKAFDFLYQTDLYSFPLGKHPVDGDNVFMIVSEYTTKLLSDARFEAHRVYADIQLLLAGEEKIGYAPVANMRVKEDYNPEKDILFLSGCGEYTTISPGVFAVFFPHDAHQPGVAIGTPQTVKKLVVKVRMGE